MDGDGSLDVVFASYDFFIWAIDSDGVPLPGFPVNTDDTVWSSPALFDVDGDGDVEIFIGGDATPGGYVDHLGGIFSAIDYREGKPELLWRRFPNEVIYSSAAIADINGDGRFEAVVGSGDNWFVVCRQQGSPQCGPNDGNDHNKVWAFHLDDGSDVAGWPVETNNTVWASPAIGDVDADGRPEVVVGSDDEHVYAYNGDGSIEWSVRPQFGHLNGGGIVRGSAVITDLDGDGDQDVAIGTSGGLSLLDGQNGAELESDLHWTEWISFAWAHDTTPAVGTLNGQRMLVFAAHSAERVWTRFAAYALPSTTSSDAWPMFRHNAKRTGTATTSPSQKHHSPEGSPRYFAAPLQWMTRQERNIIDAASAACVKPETPASRAETSLYIWRAANSLAANSRAAKPRAANPHPFSDISDVSDKELDQAVSWMYDKGVALGKRIGNVAVFAPNDLLTRAEVAAFLYRLEGEPEVHSHPFTDINRSWQNDPVSWMYMSGITVGTSDTTFSPNEPVSRGQLANFFIATMDHRKLE